MTMKCGKCGAQIAFDEKKIVQEPIRAQPDNNLVGMKGIALNQLGINYTYHTIKYVVCPNCNTKNVVVK